MSDRTLRDAPRLDQDECRDQMHQVLVCARAKARIVEEHARTIEASVQNAMDAYVQADAGAVHDHAESALRALDALEAALGNMRARLNGTRGVASIWVFERTMPTSTKPGRLARLGERMADQVRSELPSTDNSDSL